MRKGSRGRTRGAWVARAKNFPSLAACAGNADLFLREGGGRTLSFGEYGVVHAIEPALARQDLPAVARAVAHRQFEWLRMRVRLAGEERGDHGLVFGPEDRAGRVHQPPAVCEQRP